MSCRYGNIAIFDENVIIESLLYFNKIIKDSQKNLVIPTFRTIVHSIVDWAYFNMNILKRNQKDTFYFDDYAVAIMVGVGLFILPFLGEFHSQKNSLNWAFQWERFILWYENVPNWKKNQIFI